MDEATARRRLHSALGGGQPPELEEGEFEELVQIARENGWDLALAERTGWDWKAAKVAGMPDSSFAEGSMSRSQVFDMCMRKAQTGGSRRIRSIQLTGSLDTIPPVRLLPENL